MNATLIGAPVELVENYNIRLTRYATGSQARRLAKRLRGRDGGLPGVEALTLPYKGDCWEVACNLLHPTRKPPSGASTLDMDRVVKEWEQEEDSQPWQSKTVGEAMTTLVDNAYRVGTTSTQCLDVLASLTSDTSQQQEERRNQHDSKVQEQFQKYMQEF